jgi:hypothetical protein
MCVDVVILHFTFIWNLDATIAFEDNRFLIIGKLPFQRRDHSHSPYEAERYFDSFNSMR